MGFGVNTGKQVKPTAGALWKRTAAKSGKEFYSGQLEVTPDLEKRMREASIGKNGKKYIDILIFDNPKDLESKFPDMYIYFSEKR